MYLSLGEEMRELVDPETGLTKVELCENGQSVVKHVPSLSCPDSPEKACPGLGKPWQPSMLFQENDQFTVKKMFVLILL